MTLERSIMSGICEQNSLQPVRLVQDEDRLLQSKFRHGQGCTHDMVLNCTEPIAY